MMRNYIKLIRPYQWIKNLFCFSGVIFGLHFNDPHLVYASIACFLAFCMAASSVYVLNDIFDVELDREHPTKRSRPIASRDISVKHAWIFYSFLVTLALSISFLTTYLVAAAVVIYIVMNIYYSLVGKHIVILDVFIISLGFLLRVFAGTVAIGIPASEWLILCVLMLTLFLGFSKRKAELLLCEVTNSSPALKRRVLEHYEPKMLDIFIGVTACASILSYALFVVIGKPYPYILYTILFVIYGIFRYIYLLYSRNGGQDTANDLLDDKHLIIAVILWLTSYLYLIII